MRFRLRTLLIVLALGPLLISIGYLRLSSRQRWLHRKHGPFIRQATFVGNQAYSDRKLAKVIGVNGGPGGTVGVRLNAYTADESIEKIKAFYVQQATNKSRSRC